MPKRIVTVMTLAVLLGVVTAVTAMAATGSGNPTREASIAHHSVMSPDKARTLASVNTQQQGNGRWLRHELRSLQKATWHWQDLLLVHRSPGRQSGRVLQNVGYLKWAVNLWKDRAGKAKLRVQQLMANRGYLPPTRARVLGHVMAAKLYGWTGRQWGCLDEIWGRLESSWYALADNPNSEAYGIPQALPGSKMASAGANWRRSAHTQIVWGLRYIKSGYSTACGALSVRLSRGSY